MADMVEHLTITTKDVADLSPRAQQLGGGELDDFTENTKPTKERVERFIRMAYDEVVAKLGTMEEVNEKLWGDAKNAIKYYTVMLIELKYFPEQVSTSRSPYGEFKKMFDGVWRDLVEAVGGTGNTAIDELTGGASELKPQYSFDGFGIGNMVW